MCGIIEGAAPSYGINRRVVFKALLLKEVFVTPNK